MPMQHTSGKDGRRTGRAGARLAAEEGAAIMRLFTRRQGRTSEVAEVRQAAPCVHVGLTARWDSVADMGSEARATSFVCATCGAEFTPHEAEAIRSRQGDQIRRDLS